MKPFTLLPAVLIACSTFLATSVLAGSATWNSNADSGDWNTAANWTPATVPNGASDTATFLTSYVTDLLIEGEIELDALGLVRTSSTYTFTIASVDASTSSLTISGSGVPNGGYLPLENFVATTNAAGGRGVIKFTNDAYAGDSNVFFNKASSVAGGESGLTSFENSASAGLSTYINAGATVSGGAGGETNFRDTASAYGATIICNGSRVSGGTGGSATFRDRSGTSNIGGGLITATGGINGGAGGRIVFSDDSERYEAPIQLSGNAVLDLSNHPSFIVIGSLEGDGVVILGRGDLMISNADASEATFTGLIQDGTSGAAGSLQVGNLQLTLAGANTYTGGTKLYSTTGSLLVSNETASATGTGPVLVSNGIFGGNGKVSGAVILGDINTDLAILAPGIGGPGLLTIGGKLNFKGLTEYECDVDTITGLADRVRARSVKIGPGANFTLQVSGSEPLAAGTVFTIIDNKSSQPIRGKFDNLPDNSTISGGGNNFKVSYEGGDGNDLTLTVVP
jgi:hypothetical protein